MNLIIKKTKSEDVKTLKSLARKVIDKRYRKFLTDDAVDWFINSGASDNEIENNFSYCYTATIDGNICGLAILKGSLIHLLMIEFESQNKGIGTQLILELEKILFKSYETIYLECFEGNNQANGFYRKNGFNVYKTEIDKDINLKRLYYKKEKTKL